MNVLKQKLIYVCSPLKGDIEGNKRRAREYCLIIIKAGHIPYSAHTAFDGVLNDNNPSERSIGLHIGKEMVKKCDEVWVFGETVSEGMRMEIETASEANIPIKFHDTIKRNLVLAWAEGQLGWGCYYKFVEEQKKQGDNDIPAYEEWRQNREPLILAKTEELVKKGVLADEAQGDIDAFQEE